MGPLAISGGRSHGGEELPARGMAKMGGPKSHPKRDAERVMSVGGGAAAAIAPAISAKPSLTRSIVLSRERRCFPWTFGDASRPVDRVVDLSITRPVHAPSTACSIWRRLRRCWAVSRCPAVRSDC